MIRSASTALSMAAFLTVGACQQPIGQNASNAEQCKGAYDEVRAQFSRNTVGQYGAGTGVAKAIVRGQQESAYQECLARVGASGGAVASPLSYTASERGAATLSGGAGYRGSYLEGGRGSVTSAPPATVKPAKGKNLGGLALPTQYPLLPGDPELWNTLTRAQQERALLFLADGSTIAASMRTD